MTTKQDIALMRLALDALEDPKAPQPLKDAAHLFVYEGDLAPFLRLLTSAALLLIGRGEL